MTYTLTRTRVVTPTGPLMLYALDDALVCVALDGTHGADTAHERRLARHLGAFEVREADDAAGAASRLARHLAGDPTALGEQPLHLLGTAFQCQVWEILRTLPHGTTTSYTALAERLGRPTAVRAVAAANGANPVPWFVPCHRVLAADGRLWGYAGGLAMKAWLLRHEGALAHEDPRLAL